MSNVQNIYALENDNLIIDIVKFYDCLNLVKKDSVDFREESRLLLKRCINQSKQVLINNKRVKLQNSNVVEYEFHSIDKFEEWLSDDANKELGIELIKLD